MEFLFRDAGQGAARVAGSDAPAGDGEATDKRTTAPK
jgi:hypothetical protein